jgi:hypothetical protein
MYEGLKRFWVPLAEHRIRTSGIEMWHKQAVQNDIMCTAGFILPLEVDENVLYPLSLAMLSRILSSFKLSTEIILFQNKLRLLCLWILTMFLSVHKCKCFLKDNVDADKRGVTPPYCLTWNKTLNFELCVTAFLSSYMYLAIISTRIHNNDILNMSHEFGWRMMHICAFKQMEKDFLQYYFFLLKHYSITVGRDTACGFSLTHKQIVYLTQRY